MLMPILVRIRLTIGTRRAIEQSIDLVRPVAGASTGIGTGTTMSRPMKCTPMVVTRLLGSRSDSMIPQPPYRTLRTVKQEGVIMPVPPAGAAAELEPR